MLVGFHYNSNEYFYSRDLTGNIAKVLDVNGNIKVEYKYNAWGKILSITGDNTIKNVNSYLYKGYYYDFETELYYCNSRYYDSDLCRWISIDELSFLDYDDLNGINLWCYCGNNPIVGYDLDETRNWKPFWNFVGKVAIVVATAVVIAFATSISLPVALAATVVVTIAANHIDNAIKIDRAKKEVDSMSDDELDQYLSNINIENTTNAKGEIVRNFKTSEEMINFSKYDRIKLLTAIQRKYEAKNSIYVMSAEWQGHNILYGFTGNVADINIDNYDDRWYVVLGTFVLIAIGEI